MKVSSIILIFIIVLIIALIYYAINQTKWAAQRRLKAEQLDQERKEQERIRLKLEETNRLKEKEIVEQLYPALLKANENFDDLCSFKNGYFNNNKWCNWKIAVADLYNEISKYNIARLQLEPLIASSIEKFITSYNTGEAIRRNYNSSFIQQELKASYQLLSNIEGRPLDEQQRMAVIKDEDHNLVIAGAGSGKNYHGGRKSGLCN